MIRTVGMYLEEARTRVSPEQYDNADVVRAVHRAGVDLGRLSGPAEEFISDCAVWAAVSHKSLLARIGPHEDKEKALDRLAEDVIDEVGTNWSARSLLLAQKNTNLTVSSFLADSGVSRQQQDRAVMTVRAYLSEQMS